MPLGADLERLIRVIALKNAIEHEARAQPEAVISKFVGSRPDQRGNLKQIIPEIRSIVSEVNSLPAAKQASLIAELDVEYGRTQKPQASGSPSLPPLENAIQGEVITRFPPEPNGYPHIGHAKAAIIDEEYAKMYDGKLLLRFDDTNPNSEKIEYYDAIREGIEWLGVQPYRVKNTSDDITVLHKFGREMASKGAAYVCTCSQKTIHELRAKGEPCACRTDPMASERIKKFFGSEFEENEAILRFKGDMADLNTAMRDPTLFRIVEGNHPRLGTRIRVWPTYDFAAPVEDSLDGVTHAMRTKEYELRNALYFAVLEALELRKPNLTEFSRLEFEGIPVSKRKIRPLVESGTLSGWDDPRLPTLSAFRRRGFTPQGIRQFILSLGVTLAETKPPFEALESYNRKVIDPVSPRIFYVQDPFEVKIEGATQATVSLRNHPTNDSLGSRTVQVGDSVYIAGDDARTLSPRSSIRLIELFNVRVLDVDLNSRIVHAVAEGNEIVRSMPKIQWVAKNDKVDFVVEIPKHLYIGDNYNTNSLVISKGYSESFVEKLAIGTTVQFVRFGFCRLDKPGAGIFAHS